MDGGVDRALRDAHQTFSTDLVSGASILGDGRVVLILNLPAVVEHVARLRPEFVYRHQWRVGDAVLWDNRCAQHCATPFDDSKFERHMQRTTLEGERPIIAETPVLRPARASIARPSVALSG